MNFTMNRVFSISLIISLLIFSYGCIEIEKLPPQPRVEFRSFTVLDTTDLLGNVTKAGKLTFYFEDGDGDVGLDPNPTLPGDATNLFLTLYRKTDGIMLPADSIDPLFPSSYRIPYLERLGQNKILKGEITVVILYLFYEVTDTIRYDFFIQDRARNESNIETTCEIALGANGTCTAVSGD